jgi:hypothetical protein
MRQAPTTVISDLESATSFKNDASSRCIAPFISSARVISLMNGVLPTKSRSPSLRGA